MRKLIKIAALAALAATTTVLALSVGTANAGTVSTAANCTPVFAHTEYKWVPNVTNAGPTMWTTDNAAANTPRTFLWKGQPVAYHRDGTKSQFIDSVTCAVSAPMFNYDVNTCSVTVPFTPGIDTVLYAVNGYTDAPITHDVTVTGSLDGTDGTAGQFWIGYTAQPGYVITNLDAATKHIDFYNGDSVLDCGATGDVTWDYQGLVTGQVSFNADATGGSLHYQNSNDMWLDGVVSDYKRIDAHTAVFAGTITDGSLDYTDRHPGTDYFFAKVVDGTSGSPDQIAVLANSVPSINGVDYDMSMGANWDYDMSQGSGIVTAGNLVVH